MIVCAFLGAHDAAELDAKDIAAMGRRHATVELDETAPAREFAKKLATHRDYLVSLLKRYPVEVVYRGHRRVFDHSGEIDQAIRELREQL